MADPFVSNTPNLSSPAAHAVAITPDDDTDLAVTIRALYVGGAGDVTAVTAGGETTAFVGLAAGTILPVRLVRVLEASTATDLVGLY